MKAFVRICTTNRLFVYLLGIILLSILSMLYLTVLASDNESTDEEESELDSPLKRVKRLLSFSPTPYPSLNSPRAHTITGNMQQTPAVALKLGGPGGKEAAGSIITDRSKKPDMFAGKPANNITLTSNNFVNESINISDEIEGVGDARFGLSPNATMYLVVILIHSNIDQSLRRKTIRETWLSPRMLNASNVTHWFVIGGNSTTASLRNDLQKEQDQHGDLLILWNVRNDYAELTLRSLHSMIHIYNHYLFEYVLKTDDDVFLNTPVILSELNSSFYPRKRIYWGRFSCRNPPMVDGRWKETNWNLCDVYYPYAYGGMYVLSQDVVGLLVENANSLQIYSCEDVSLGAWLAPYNIHRINDGRIFVQHSTKCSRGYIAVHIPHRLSYKLMMKYFDNLKRKGVICSTVCKDDILLWRGLPHLCLNETKAIV
ncbi:PREDICTED: beta-1,3-galactosyltransferase 6-like [Amphimedon queenslandica]|uniref:Hexosyltransferase n=1 Tax=Amphimedon queenslandica TaxID=400682 RepID=A0A1X7UHI8_AMPQE|nr:PREDICTED: beta-1,3-galactosyltransferase 6-like [Amphimedon queenslandica]|eukprot:XP_011405158.1 PREDICTED: beta-1,3-galactosyltransferase 6-like [Amphimedon queenslandica]